MQKKSAFVLAVFLCLSMLAAGCGSGGNTPEGTKSQNTTAQSLASQNGPETNSNLTAPGTFPIVKNKVTLKCFGAPPSWIGDLNTNTFTKYFENKTNIHIEWTRANMEEYADKLNLILASQSDMPDVFLSWGISNAQQITYGAQGVFIPLNDLIEKYGAATKQVFAYNDQIKPAITAPDGKIYGLPAINECFHCTYSFKMWIDQKWLDNLGMKTPATTDEFYEVLKAFKEKDPNKNGKQDEIPLSRGSWQSGIDFFLMNAFCQNEAGNRLYLENDKMVQAPVKDEWREGLKYLRKLYAEGLMDPEVFLQDDNKVKLLTGAKDGNRVGAVASGALAFVDQSNADDPNSTVREFTALEPLTGPKGFKQAKQYGFGMGSGNFVITKECKEPEAAFRLGDALYQMYIDEDFNLNGEEGKDWEKAKPGDLGLDGSPAKYRLISDGQQPNNFTWNDTFNTFMTAAFRNGLAVVQGKWNHEKVLYDETKAKYAAYGPKQVMPNSFFMDEKDSAEYNELNGTVIKYLDDSIAKWVTGVWDINSDKDWENYKNELKKTGYDRLAELQQQAYDKQYKGK